MKLGISVATGSGSAEFGACPGTMRIGIAVKTDTAVLTGSGSAEFGACPGTMRIGTAVKPDTAVAPDSGSAELEATSLDIPAPRCVPNSPPRNGKHRAIQHPLVPRLPGTNSEDPSSVLRTVGLPGGFRRERARDVPDRAPKPFSLDKRLRRDGEIHDDGRSSY